MYIRKNPRDLSFTRFFI